MSDVVSSSSDGFEAFTNLNAGFLGTGSSTLVELAYLVMVLIAGYVAVTTVRYFLPETRFLNTIAAALGLRNS